MGTAFTCPVGSVGAWEIATSAAASMSSDCSWSPLRTRGAALRARMPSWPYAAPKPPRPDRAPPPQEPRKSPASSHEFGLSGACAGLHWRESSTDDADFGGWPVVVREPSRGPSSHREAGPIVTPGQPPRRAESPDDPMHSPAARASGKPPSGDGDVDEQLSGESL